MKDDMIPVKESDISSELVILARYAPETIIEIKYSNAASNMFKYRVLI